MKWRHIGEYGHVPGLVYCRTKDVTTPARACTLLLRPEEFPNEAPVTQ